MFLYTSKTIRVWNKYMFFNTQMKYKRNFLFNQVILKLRNHMIFKVSQKHVEKRIRGGTRSKIPDSKKMGTTLLN